MQENVLAAGALPQTPMEELTGPSDSIASGGGAGCPAPPTRTPLPLSAVLASGFGLSGLVHSPLTRNRRLGPSQQ